MRPTTTYMQMHHPVNYAANLLFVDSHLASKTLKPKPAHLRNKDNAIVRPNYLNKP